MHMHSILSNDMPQIEHLVQPKFTLGQLRIELLSLQNTKDLLDMLQVLLPCLAVDQSIMKEHQYKYAYFLAEHMDHAIIKGSRSIGQCKGNNRELEMAIVTPKHYIRDILIPHPNLMVPRIQIYLREVLGLSKLIHKLIYVGDGVSVLQHLLVKGSIVHAHPQRAILLLHQDN